MKRPGRPDWASGVGHSPDWADDIRRALADERRRRTDTGASTTLTNG